VDLLGRRKRRGHVRIYEGRVGPRGGGDPRSREELSVEQVRPEVAGDLTAGPPCEVGGVLSEKCPIQGGGTG
jgi:hypothetical protein